jgi:hypothetical protein
MPQQPILPTWLALNACNDTSASFFSDLRTGQPVNAGGLNNGDYFDLTNGEAAQLSYTATGLLYAGRYRRVLVDSGATAANVKTGTIGLMPSLAAVIADGDPLGKPTENIVTSYDQAGGSGTAVRPVVFLNSITPGNFGFVQELGIATVLGKASLTNATPAPQDIIIFGASGLADDPTQSTSLTYALQKQILGTAIDLPKQGGLFRIQLSLPVVQD